MESLKEKVIVVTGGTGLIGREIVRVLDTRDSIVYNADINHLTNSTGRNLTMDVTSEKSILDGIEAIMREHGRIDGWVNNAYPRTEDWGNFFEDVSLDSWRTNVDKQLNSCFFICQRILDIMKNQGYGSLVNIASIYGVVGNDFTIYENTDMTSPAAYAAIKGGLINFTRYLASYYGSYGVRVNCLSPGGVFNNQDLNFVRQFEHKVPLKRMARAEEIAAPVAFLLSDESTYITGHNLLVDGGWTAI